MNHIWNSPSYTLECNSICMLNAVLLWANWKLSIVIILSFLHRGNCSGIGGKFETVDRFYSDQYLQGKLPGTGCRWEQAEGLLSSPEPGGAFRAGHRNILPGILGKWMSSPKPERGACCVDWTLWKGNDPNGTINCNTLRPLMDFQEFHYKLPDHNT